MKQLYLSELSRYKKWILLGFVVLTFIFAYENSDSSILPVVLTTVVNGLVFLLVSLIFGLVQMRAHKRENQWTYLVHRPLSTQKIFITLTGAGMSIIFLMLIAPFLLVIIYLDAFSTQVIDLRDYGAILVAFLGCCVLYLISCLIILNPSKGSALIFLSFLFSCIQFIGPSNLGQFLVPLIWIAPLYYLNSISFKPDLKSYLSNPIGIFVHSLSMLIGILFIFSALIEFGEELSQIPIRNGGTDLAGRDLSALEDTHAYFYLVNEPEQRLAYALEESDHPDVAYYVTQAELAETNNIPNRRANFPYRGKISAENERVRFNHPETNSIWEFSHSSMLLEGRHSLTGESMGFVGQQGFLQPGSEIAEADRFDEVPLMHGATNLITPTTIYSLDFSDQLLEVKHQLSGEERYEALPAENPNFISIKTNRYLLMFDRRAFLDEGTLATPDYVVPYPTSFGRTQQISTYQLVDGYLVLFRGNNFHGPQKPGVEVVHARLGGDIETIGGRTFTEFYSPAWIRQNAALLSPALVAATIALSPGREDSVSQRLIDHFSSLSVYPQMLALHLISIALLLLMFRLHSLSRGQIVVWCLLVGIFGLTALVSFFLLNPWKPIGRTLLSRFNHRNGGRGEALSI